MPKKTVEDSLVDIGKAILKESVDYFNTLSVYDKLDDDGFILLGGSGAKGSAFNRAGFKDENELTKGREVSRILAEINEYAINAIENRISYVVGTGHISFINPRKNEEVDIENIKAVQKYLDEWQYENNWHVFQQENQRRLDRDGEVFIRFFLNQKEPLKFRYVEPYEVTQTNVDDTRYDNDFGIATDKEDASTIKGYWVNQQFVKPDLIQHRKANVDSNVKRGIPLLWPVRDSLRRIEKIYRNAAIVTEIQTAIALIRKHKNTPASQASTFRGNKAQNLGQDANGKAKYKQTYAPGTILDSSANIEYEMPAGGLDPSRYIAVAQQQLRAVSARLTMPEFMLTSDASNANYSSTMVAEGPAVKCFQRLQTSMEEADKRILWKVLSHAAETGQIPNILDKIELQIEAPSLVARDFTKEVARDQILFNSKVMSPQTFAARHGLDYEQELKNIQSIRDAVPTPAQAALDGVIESLGFKKQVEMLYQHLLEDRHEH